MVLPKNTVPSSGRVLPVMMSIIVVLPAPLGPMMQRSSPGAMSSDSLLMALKPSKLTLTSSRYRMRPWVTSTSPAVARRPKPAWRPPDSVLSPCGTCRERDAPLALFHQVGRHFNRSLICLTRPTTPLGRNSVTAMNSAPRK